MDVRCEQCGTEYEFDDAKVTEGGIAVKCTHCGFLFRVVRQPAAIEPPASAPEVAAPPPARPPVATADLPLLPRAPTPHRTRAWMIRKERTGDILEFKDLSTLQKWILERKVTRDDEISKTGESWKPLGSIVELSSFFLVVEGESLRSLTQVPSPEPPTLTPQAHPQVAPIRPNLAPPAPPRGRDDLLDTGEFRLEGPAESDSAPPSASRPLTGSLSAGTKTPLPAPTESGTTRRVQAPLGDHTPQVTVSRTPAPRAPIGRQDTPGSAFDLGPGSAPAPRGNTARGFVIGVGVTGALFAVAYGAFEHLNQDRTHSNVPRGAAGSAGPAVVAPTAAIDVATRLDAADARVRSDADAELDLAIPEYDAILFILGDPPGDRMLAARALVGKARVLLARAEHRLLAGEVPGAVLSKVNDLLAAARVNAPDLPDIELAWADSLRLREERVSVRNFLDAAAAKASTRAEYAFLRAMNEGSEEPGAVADRLAALTPEARSMPRVMLLRALALEKAQRREEALQVVGDLLRASPSHAQAIDLKARLLAAPATPPTAPGSSVAPPITSAPPTAAPTAPVKVSAPPSAVRVGEDATTIRAADDFDGFMLRGARNLEAGRPDVAAKFFEKAIQQKPRSPEPFANLGWCYVDQRRYAEALGQFQQALERSPRYADAMYGMAEANEKAGKFSEAIDAYKVYLTAHPSGRRSEMVRRRLERLQ